MSFGSSASKPSGQRPHSSKATAFGQIVLLLGSTICTIAIADILRWPLLGPLSVIPPVALGLYLMHRWHESPSLIGIRRPTRPLNFALFVLATVVVSIVFNGIGQAVAGAIFDSTASIDALGTIKGNLPRYLVYLLISWTTAAIGEELLFRGMVMRHLETILGSSNPRLALVILIQAITFGLFHSYQGVVGIFGTGAIAIAMGLFFYLSKRTIWTCVVAHGIIDTIGFTEEYLK